ncbi:MAG: ABC transporter ATP-binding protein [Desulfatibacillaceae bacterium]
MSGETNEVIRTRALSRRYGRQMAVDRLDLSVLEGEIFGFLGPNGSGKTTTLLMLLGLTEPTAGTARVCGLDPNRDAVAVKRQVGYLPENLGFYPDMNARENLGLVAALNGMDKADSRSLIDGVLDTVGLADVGDKKLAAYSRGMRQRLGIAEILVKRPRVVFLDEPTLGLDPSGADRIVRFIHDLARDNGMTVMLSSHDLRQVQRICDRVGIMSGGRLVACGTLDELAGDGPEAAGRTLDDIYLRYFEEGPE